MLDGIRAALATPRSDPDAPSARKDEPSRKERREAKAAAKAEARSAKGREETATPSTAEPAPPTPAGGYHRELLERAVLAMLDYVDDHTDGFRILARDSSVASGSA